MPTVKELNLKLYEYHCENFHCNYKDVQDKFIDGFYGLNSKIEEYKITVLFVYKTLKPFIE